VPAPPGKRIAGIPIYDVKPILIVTANSATVELVPNYNRAYGLRFGSFLAKHHFKADLSGGIISKIDSEQDSTEALKLLEVLGKAVIDKIPIPSAQSRELGGGVGAPQRFAVFSFDFDSEGNLIALRPLVSGDSLIHVPKAPNSNPRTLVQPATAGGSQSSASGDF